jgi:hypothetical protein
MFLPSDTFLTECCHPADPDCAGNLTKIRDTENPSQIIGAWLRICSTIESMGLREMLNNSHFKPLENEGFKTEAKHIEFYVFKPSRKHKTFKIN